MGMGSLLQCGWCGFNDDLLEKNFSRSCPPNINRPECLMVVILFTLVRPICCHTRDPKMLMDTVGTVLFSKGRDNAGGLNFPKKNQINGLGP